MEQIRYTFDHATIPPEKKSELAERLIPEIGRLQGVWGSGYATEYASLSLPSDNGLLDEVKTLAAQKKKELNPDVMIVIGIGGSSLGALAVQIALGQSAFEVHFADTVAPRHISNIYFEAEELLKQNKEILVVIISKSGTTTETIANAQLFTALLQQYKKDTYAHNLVIISDKRSPLIEVAKKHQFAFLTVPPKVGGRYSVFSAVGLFPLSMMGIDIGAMREGAQSMKDPCTHEQLDANPAALSASTLYHLYQEGMHIHDTFAFSHALYGIGEWYRQLMAESIGKADSKEGKPIHVGITPTISIGSVDLHSMAQLYLGGPNNRVTTFVTIAEQSDIQLPTATPFDELVPMIEGKSFNTIMDAIVKGTQKAYADAKRPFMTIELPQISAYHCGQLLQMKMVEIMYLGFLFNINPFDQPQVELYKKETRKILSHE